MGASEVFKNQSFKNQMNNEILVVFKCKRFQSPHFSTNVVNAVNFQVNFRNLHHSLQGLKLSCLQLIFEEDVNIDLGLI